MISKKSEEKSTLDQKGYPPFDLENGLKSNVKYTEIAQFAAMKDCAILKVLVIGEIGSGKSSLMSKMTGVKLMHSDNEFHMKVRTEYGELIRVDDNKLEDHFNVDNTSESVTKESGFVLSRLLGNESRRQVMLIDSPGFFDPEEAATDKIRDNLGIKDRKRITDYLTEKLQALGSVDAIILMMPIMSWQLTQNIVTAMKSLEFMFHKSKGKFISNLALAHTKCDEAMERNYISKMKNKGENYMALIETLQTYGVEVMKRDCSQLFFLTSEDETLDSIGRKDEFERLFSFFNDCSPIKTDQIQNPKEILQGLAISLKYDHLLLVIYAQSCFSIWNIRILHLGILLEYGILYYIIYFIIILSNSVRI